MWYNVIRKIRIQNHMHLWYDTLVLWINEYTHGKKTRRKYLYKYILFRLKFPFLLCFVSFSVFYNKCLLYNKKKIYEWWCHFYWDKRIGIFSEYIFSYQILFLKFLILHGTNNEVLSPFLLPVQISGTFLILVLESLIYKFLLVYQNFRVSLS